MSSIYNITQELLNLQYELEENGGELTPELAQQYIITQEAFKDKVKQYAEAIKSLNSDIADIMDEQARLKQLKDKKERALEVIKGIMVSALEEFGDTKKSGVKYVDYGTGELSVRKTPAVEVNDALVTKVAQQLYTLVKWNKEINQLDTADCISADSLTGDYDGAVAVSEEELNNINIDVALTIPLRDLLNGNGYSPLKEIVKYTDGYDLFAKVQKTTLKDKLKENGEALPNLAKLVTHKSLQMK